MSSIIFSFYHFYFLKVQCFQNVCDKIAKKIVQSCGHFVNIPCNQDVSTVLCNHKSHQERRQFKYYNRNEAYTGETWSDRSNKSLNNNANKSIDDNNNHSGNNISKHDNEDDDYKRETRNYQHRGFNARSGFNTRPRINQLCRRTTK
jgi:hypothetical protein